MAIVSPVEIRRTREIASGEDASPCADQRIARFHVRSAGRGHVVAHRPHAQGGAAAARRAGHAHDGQGRAQRPQDQVGRRYGGCQSCARARNTSSHATADGPCAWAGARGGPCDAASTTARAAATTIT